MPAEGGDHRRAARPVRTSAVASPQSRAVRTRLPQGHPRHGRPRPAPAQGLAERDRRPATARRGSPSTAGAAVVATGEREDQPRRRVGRARAVRRRPPKSSSSPPMPGRRVSRCGKSPAWWSSSPAFSSRPRCSSRGCMCRTPTRPWSCCQGAWRVAGAETRASPLSTSCTSSAGRCGMPSSWRPGNGTGHSRWPSPPPPRPARV